MPEEAIREPLSGAVPDTHDVAFHDTHDGAVSEALAGAVPETLAGAVPDADAGIQSEDFQPVSPEDAPAAIEALLFAAGDPLDLDQLARILGLERTLVRRILDGLIDRHHRDRSRGLALREADGTFTLATKPAQKDVLARLLSPRNRPPLSAAAYETLAIIAYNQPVTRAQIEAVRGVNSDNVLQRLVERGLVRDAGTLDAPGRPTLFATSEQFLLDFGLRSVADLPPMEMLMYGTLRDIEQALREAANMRQDRQLTIEQLPGGLADASGSEPEEPSAAGLAEPSSIVPSDPRPMLDGPASVAVIGMSAALFGMPPETVPDSPQDPS